MGQVIFICCATYFTSQGSSWVLSDYAQFTDEEIKALVTCLRDTASCGRAERLIHTCAPSLLRLTPSLSACSLRLLRGPVPDPRVSMVLGWCYRSCLMLPPKEVLRPSRPLWLGAGLRGVGWGHTVKMDPVLPFEMCDLREWSVLVGCCFNILVCSGDSCCFIISVVVLNLKSIFRHTLSVPSSLRSPLNTWASRAQISPALTEKRTEIRLE